MNKTIFALVSVFVLAPCAIACNPDPTPPPAPSAPVIEPSEAPVAPTPAPASSLPRFSVEEQVAGPIRLGMTVAELEGLGLPLKKDDTFGEGYWVGPYRVMMDDQSRVDFVQFELAALKDGLAIGAQTVPATEKDIEAIAALLPGCGKVQIRTGGNVIECADRKASVAAAGPPGIVQLTLMSAARVATIR